jgi:hypothetical protein
MAPPLYFFLAFGAVAVITFIVLIREAPLIIAIGGGVVGGLILLIGLGYVVYRYGHYVNEWWIEEKVARQARRVEQRKRREDRERAKERAKEEARRRKEEQRVADLERRRVESGFVAVEAIV